MSRKLSKREKEALKKAQQGEGDDQEVVQKVYNRDSSPELTKWQLSGDDLILQLRAKLRGKRLIEGEDGKLIEVEIGDPLLPEDSVDDVINLVNFYINKNMQLSEFTPEEIHRLMRDMKKDLVHYFYLAALKGEIEFKKLYIAKQVGNFIWGAINRAKYGGEKEFLQKSEERRIDVSSKSDSAKQGNMLDKFRRG